MSDPVIYLLGILIVAVAGPALTLFFNRSKDGTSLAQNALTVANQAVADLKDAKAEIRTLQAARVGPFHVHLTITLDPLSVQAMIIEDESEKR